MSPELSRRDALVALGAAGAAVGGGALAWDRIDDPSFGERERETLVAVARTVYPSEVSGVAAFVERYVVGRVEDRPAYAAGVADAASALDRYARTHEGARFVDLDPDERDALLRRMAVDVADPDPEGTDAARVRFYLVNELLYALYTSPTGGELVGLENPQGYPGGIDSYQRPPE